MWIEVNTHASNKAKASAHISKDFPSCCSG